MLWMLHTEQSGRPPCKLVVEELQALLDAPPEALASAARVEQAREALVARRLRDERIAGAMQCAMGAAGVLALGWLMMGFVDDAGS